MLVLRYFVFVGGALFALLWGLNAELPKPSARSPATIASSNDLPVIRINSSERKGPDRIVFDTNAPMPITVAKANTPVRTPVLAQIAPKATVVHEAFAQSPPSKPTHVVVRAKKLRHRPLYRHRYARARVPRYFSRPPMMIVAQQPRFGFFNW